MSQRDVGLILMRQLAAGLAIPVLIVDQSGELLFFNEAAEALMGVRFDEFGDTRLVDRLGAFELRDVQGHEVPNEQVPMYVAMRELRPVHRQLWGRGLDGVQHQLENTAFPLLGAGGHLIGAVSMFWERKSDQSGDQAHANDTAGAAWRPSDPH